MILITKVIHIDLTDEKVIKLITYNKKDKVIHNLMDNFKENCG